MKYRHLFTCTIQEDAHTLRCCVLRTMMLWVKIDPLRRLDLSDILSTLGVCKDEDSYHIRSQVHPPSPAHHAQSKITAFHLLVAVGT